MKQSINGLLRIKGFFDNYKAPKLATVLKNIAAPLFALLRKLTTTDKFLDNPLDQDVIYNRELKFLPLKTFLQIFNTKYLRLLINSGVAKSVYDKQFYNS